MSTAAIPFAMPLGIKMPDDGATASSRVSYADTPIPENLPVRVTGFRLLVRLFTVEKKVGSIYMPDNERDREQFATIIGRVVEVGSLAYKDQSRFPDGPWCSLGDTVVFKSYAGDRVAIDGEEYRIINDDQVTCVVHDPARVSRA